ncbi:MAG: peptidase E [Clostridia bacterium]|nr:peptidase E [Clostridia bacterium]
MDKYIVAIGGGELRSKETLEIDRQIAEMAKDRVGERRAVALFIGTASHDSMPYYNTFHKTYTGELGLKTDCVLTVYGEMNYEKIVGKFQKADMIYVGGGDTVFMLNKWKETGIDKLILDAYERGVIISGLSAGAICWFEKMYSDSNVINGESDEYAFFDGLGILKGGACPHFNERKNEFLNCDNPLKKGTWYCIENNSAIVFKNGVISDNLSNGGKSCVLNF